MRSRTLASRLAITAAGYIVVISRREERADGIRMRHEQAGVGVLQHEDDAQIDELTGLATRRGFFEQATAVFSTPKRRKTRS